MSRGNLLFTLLVLIIFVLISGLIKAEVGYYYLTNNGFQNIELNDTLVLIRTDTLFSLVPHSYAVGYLLIMKYLTVRWLPDEAP